MAESAVHGFTCIRQSDVLFVLVMFCGKGRGYNTCCLLETNN